MRLILVLLFSLSSVFLFGQETKETIEIDTIATINNEVVDTSKIYRVDEIQQVPEFVGGNQAFYKFLSENLKYPSHCKDSAIVGKVYLEFVIETSGKVNNIKVLRSVHGLLAEEAVRLMESSPKWNPGRLDGKLVRSRFVLPISFNLN